ncbi:hypothetical protein JTE88_02560 [Arcanobacterium phocisimile]|uniref:Uncharacterized protein n=1 Tax=Arcanobacterium phocisimile TaxID=1302235 RepID=A0ABX7II32_9ACTO|nr:MULTISPECIES: hypothetical protein [Arcanobacterium]QRV02641.1 hypothetical protein JTE88_02560 [Arcanobacterium phocisimile]
MSTTIDVYPATGFMPFVEQTRARTQELFQNLLDRYEIGSQIEIKAFYPSTKPLRYIDKDLVWEPGMDLGFAYWINGEWDSSSWPSCLAVGNDDRITEEDLVYPFDSKPEHLGLWSIVEEFEDLLPPKQLAKILAQDHYWFEYRNVGGPALASTGYGLVAAAIAEATQGIIATFDCAFEERNGQSADEFLSWWGDSQLRLYGAKSFA